MECNFGLNSIFKQFAYFLRLLGGALFELEGVDRFGLLLQVDLGVS
jgi:hypothetical protein